MRTLEQQIRDAFERSGLSVDQVLKKSGLRIHRSALHRRLHDGARETPMKTSEAEKLAVALGITLVWNRPRRAARRAA